METKQTSKELLSDLLNKHYDEAAAAKSNGEIVAWSTSIAPQELLETLDIKVVYPENHAAAIGARKCAQEFIDQAEGDGYSTDLCSYARVNIGYMTIQESIAGNIPLPDVLFCCNNICNTVIKWYENIAKELNVPMILFDMPFNHTYEVADHSVRYIRSQFEHAITQLESISGKKFDRDRFKEVMRISSDTARWWKKATSLAAAKPSPLNGFDMFNYMATIVCLRGKQEGLDLFKLWADELQAKIAQGAGPWHDQEEKYRVMWDGIACWPYLGNTYKVLKKHGINMVTSTYPDSWTIVYDSDDLDGMARAYSSNYVNRNLEFGTDNIVKLVQDFALDGIIYHSNRSCKLMDFRQYEVQRKVQARSGVPSVIFDGDQTDPRAFSLAQYETRIQALVEMMEQNKQGKDVE
ncbi:MAG: 2-hydroxyacyl-CoA dehydratase family protein [Anaerolineaceae bacterium]|nr:2-hydroxyacyl-CoA dehydratase family protein [Anaerolineaceae bacterium]